MNNIVILGAGIAGISAAYHLHKNGVNSVCYEEKDKAGGLLASFEVNGFRFDNAVHLSFTKDEYVRSLFDKVEYYTHLPHAYCYEAGLWLKHPVQNNLYPLSTNEKVELISSFIQRPDLLAENYHSWLLSQYGELIAKRYPIKYTERYWDMHASQLSLTWINNRLRLADSKEILRGAFEQRDDNHYYANEMRYPKKGGYISFIEGMVKVCDIRLNNKAESISLSNKTIKFSNGDAVNYDDLISSLPLPEIINIIDDVPEDIKKAANSLLYTSIDLISVGFNIPSVPPYLWFYIYDGTVAARAYSPSIKSPDAVPLGCSSLQFEIYSISNGKRNIKETLIDDVRNFLMESKLCSEDNILFMHHKRVEYGNVVFDHGMESRRDLVTNFLFSVNIHTCGRFGEWDYFWSDQSLLSGKKTAEELIKK